jgi:hypothetical protein
MTTEDQEDRRTARQITGSSRILSDAALYDQTALIAARQARMAGLATQIALADCGVRLLRERGEAESNETSKEGGQ